jgi:tRNA-splicing ligase RtcB
MVDQQEHFQTDGQALVYPPRDEGAVIKAWVKGVQVADNALQQVRNLATMPFVHRHVALMPDVHWGMGSTVGSVFATRGAIIPAAVGVDIGCGMMAVRTSLTASDLPDDLSYMRSFIEEIVPHGRTDNGGPGDRGAWGDVPDTHTAMALPHLMSPKFNELLSRHQKLEQAFKRAPHHFGTLGTGNHFIEICLDEEDRVWAMLHSGSRGIGNRIGSYFIQLAKKDMQRWFINLPDKDLAYFPEGSEHFGDYITAVNWAQEFSRLNREMMMQQTLHALRQTTTGFTIDRRAINCHHNYVQKEHHFGTQVFLTRKGAVSAQAGEMGIIPGSMGARSYIVRGLGNRESFNSCSHGAGRVMSRTEARKTFTLEDHAKATEGVECRKDADVLDETPAAYKDIDAVMEAQKDLVAVVHTLKQVVCVKG